MPEEVNRILTDHCSDLLFAPTEHAAGILRGEGLPESRVFVTGNTIVDAVYENLELADKQDSLKDLGASQGEYFVATLHRQENVDHKERFTSIIKGLELVSRELDIPVIGWSQEDHPTCRVDELWRKSFSNSRIKT